MEIQFIKYHGLGNDYLFIDMFTHPPIPEVLLPEIARQMSDRHRGIGSDGIVLILSDTECDAGMRIFNSDGSEADTCGNALRCIARHEWEKGSISSDSMTIKTGGGIVRADIQADMDGFRSATIHMGRPRWSPKTIPLADGINPLSIKLDVGHRQYDAVCLSVGNPHCVIFLEDIDKKTVLEDGPLIENHVFFPDRINVDFCRILTPDNLNLVVWERGSGYTQACGSGATAAFAAARKIKNIASTARVHLPGGTLILTETKSGCILMQGPAQKVFSGSWQLHDATMPPQLHD
jgi:diaminopimelate epimerase